MAEIKIKMDKTAIILSAIVGSLGLLSAILGFAAEGANTTNPTPALGICALVFLLMAQITVSAVSGCCGCCKSRAIPSETKRVVGIVCAVGSWIAAVAGCVMFEESAALNFRGYYIGGLYAGGGVLALAATALGIASYILLRGQPAAAAAKTPGEQPAPAGIAMGQPQFLPNMQSPAQGRGQV
ncbi:hypothetical protein SEVIR_3G235600v4 [Setaria viridis]|uniref:Uncharacterized protein n=3 Tax=Setaria TaxID=4554 RepID=A0A368QHW0_SETIT|nr:uncharacterized protein LOC101756874 [Setaria italica]XP_034588674.1 uncharacterized protein LOC117850898 [Setaria viridis]RCV17566.1 hypothetical protein SETIT_3G230100v2 [Setaria italica]TKW27097.1 hypothetical protein SEVIR_3G235600v2 [Setaria viridis]